MIQSRDSFLGELEDLLASHQDKGRVLREYEEHINHLMEEMDEADKDKLTCLIHEKIGTPKEIASIWNAEWSVTPGKTQWLFVSANILLFISGSILTLLYNQYSWGWLHVFWMKLTGVPSVIIAVYIVFWVLLGYEIGKEFGSKGKTLLFRTMLLSLIPNILLMNLVLFHLIPHEWFDPLLNRSFIMTCILFTILLFPISWFGYRWGRRASV
ncbi:HAAS signaling domain-containing protein [Bacillus sp. AK031]